MLKLCMGYYYVPLNNRATLRQVCYTSFSRIALATASVAPATCNF